jgi:hypothetical protein
MAKAIVFTWVSGDAIELWLLIMYEGDRVFRGSGNLMNRVRVKNAIAEEIRSKTFTSGLLIEKAIAFSLRMRSPALMNLVCQC